MTEATHHGFLEDYDFLELPQESAWEPEWDPPPEFPLDDPPVLPVIPDDTPPHTLAGRYARMTLDKEETTLFDATAGLATLNVGEHEAELYNVLTTTFECLGCNVDTDTRSSAELITELQDKSNYAVEQVVRTMNKVQYKMHRTVAESYNLHGTRTTYHGTSRAASVLITNTGFKGAACDRALYGRGVYSSPSVWVALGYAPTFDEARQVVFVVDYLQGPYAAGSKDQVDFGVDGFGQEILTLTSPDESILCASRENQLLATHRITVRYLTDRPYTQRIKDCVQVVHPSIGTLIKSWGKTPTAPSATTKSGWMRGTTGEVDTKHSTYKIGDPVVVTGELKGYEDLVHQTGVIKRIVKGHHYFFCVLLDCPEKRLSVKDINSLRVNRVRFPFLKPDEQELLCLKVGHIEKRKPQDTSAGADGASLGKRKADADGV